MRIRFTRFFSALAPALFCTIAFSSALADAGQASSLRESMTHEPLLLAVNNDHDSNNNSNSSSNSSNGNNSNGNNNGGNNNGGNNNGGKDDHGKDDHDKDNQCKGDHCKKVYVCHVLPNGKYMTQYLPKETAEKLAAKHPDEWILGKCEDVISPSGERHKHY